MYAISAVRIKQRRDMFGATWVATTQVPTFYLDENVQGIISEDHAVKIARDILGDNVTITAVYVYGKGK